MQKKKRLKAFTNIDTNKKQKARKPAEGSSPMEQKAEDEQLPKKYAPDKSTSSVSVSSTFFYPKQSEKPQQSEEAYKLSEAVLTANQKGALSILVKDPELLLVPVFNIKDPSMRLFPEATAADLIIWCGDMPYMGEAIKSLLKSLPDQKVAKKVQIAWDYAIKAYVAGKGLRYQLPDGGWGQSKTINLDGLINALRTFKEGIQYGCNIDIVEKNKKKEWCTHVGKQQFLLPDVCMYRLLNSYNNKHGKNLPVFKREWEFHYISEWNPSTQWRTGVNNMNLGNDYALFIHFTPNPSYDNWESIVEDQRSRGAQYDILDLASNEIEGAIQLKEELMRELQTLGESHVEEQKAEADHSHGATFHL